MSRRKLLHFAQMKSWPNVFEAGFPSDPKAMRGRWRENYFNNSHPLVLELGCGRGNYTLALAQRLPRMNFIGIDVKGGRMWHGAKAALDQKLSNVAFARLRIEDLSDYFSSGEVNEIWITFPDPHPCKGRERKRLTSLRFLRLYHSILVADGQIHLKTDHEGFFRYSLEVFPAHGFVVETAIEDLYRSGASDPVLTEIQTTFEKRHLAEGRTIFYLCVRKKPLS